mmetsp:Transcript_25859/g.58260  ORF Transcript_25859/g.58260 Transcript_25859/m.58260 type:complete len:125 (-) Transcript_25859:711-1085(-)
MLTVTTPRTVPTEGDTKSTCGAFVAISLTVNVVHFEEPAAEQTVNVVVVAGSEAGKSKENCTFDKGQEGSDASALKTFTPDGWVDVLALTVGAEPPRKQTAAWNEVRIPLRVSSGKIDRATGSG